MGMYTEILVKAILQNNVSDDVKDVLNFMFNRKGEQPANLPSHPFFNTPRWTMVGSCSSHYHVPWSDSKYSENYIFSRSDLKNYDNEIDLFFDWIKPYCTAIPGKCIGWKWYEEDDSPTLVTM